MGIGKSGEQVDKNKLSIKFGEFEVTDKGKVSDNYDEQKLKEYMKWDSILIEVSINQGDSEFECYTCDFTTILTLTLIIETCLELTLLMIKSKYDQI